MESLKCQNKEVKNHYEDSCEPPVMSDMNLVFQANEFDIVL